MSLTARCVFSRSLSLLIHSNMFMDFLLYISV